MRPSGKARKLPLAASSTKDNSPETPENCSSSSNDIDNDNDHNDNDDNDNADTNNGTTPEHQQAQNKCTKCGKRRARSVACTQKRCSACCDDEDCEFHVKAKEQRTWRAQVLAGTTDVQRLAADIRERRLQPGVWREPLFAFTGDSIVLWDLRSYAKNPKWRDEAIRKSKRRHAATGRPRLVRRGLAAIVNQLHEKAQKQQSPAAAAVQVASAEMTGS